LNLGSLISITNISYQKQLKSNLYYHSTRDRNLGWLTTRIWTTLW